MRIAEEVGVACSVILGAGKATRGYEGSSCLYQLATWNRTERFPDEA